MQKDTTYYGVLTIIDATDLYCTMADSREHTCGSGGKYACQGFIYQLKLLMLFLNRGCQRGYEFHLATEMVAAEHFDDIVFKFIDDATGTEVLRFLQAKHKLDENKKKIRAADLLRSNAKGQFNLEKYFKAYCAIKKRKEFSTARIKDLIICTNITFDFEELSSNKNITLKRVEEMDDILYHEPFPNKTPACYKFDNFPEKEIFYLTSDLRKLAKLLAELVLLDLPTTCDNNAPLMNVYQYALIEEKVVDVDKERLHHNFINDIDLSAVCREFRNLFLMYGLEKVKKNVNSESEEITEATLWTKVQQQKLKLKKGFGRRSADIKCQLPNDLVRDEKIEEFLQLLTFAVNQPNENELGEIIRKEIAQEFRLTDGGLFTDALYKHVWEWMTGLDEYYLSNLDRKRLFAEMRSRWSRLAVVGIASDNPEKQLAHGDFFSDVSELKHFIGTSASSENSLLCAILTNSTSLSFIKVVQAVQNRPSDGYAAFNWKGMLVNRDKIVSAFAMNEPFILIVELDLDTFSPDEITDFNSYFDRLIPELQQKSGQLIILIISHKHAVILQSPRFNDRNCIPFINNCSFSDLKEDTKDRLLEKQIVFQGQKMQLTELLSKNAQCIDTIVTERFLDQIVSGHTPIMGTPLSSLGDVVRYYIERKFEIHVAFTSACLVDKSSHDVLVINGATENQLSTLIPDESVKVRDYRDYKGYINQCSIIAATDNLTVSQICDICKNYPDKNVHFLSRDGDQFIWQHYRDKKNKVDESSFLNNAMCPDKIIVIAGGPGIGKTTALTNLSIRTKMEHPSYWVIKINFIDYTDQLLNTTFNSLDNVADFICAAADIQQEFERKFLEAQIKQEGHIVLFFDGFDEICPKYKEKVVRMLRLLKETNVERVWVTTRLRYQQELVDCLQVTSYQLIPFSAKDQKRFIKEFWLETLSPDVYNNPNTKRSIKRLNKHFVESTDNEMRKFIGIPLQTRLITEVYKQQSQQFQDGNFVDFDLQALYARFIENRYRIYCEEKVRMDFTIPDVDIFVQDGRKVKLKKHQALAFSMIFPEKCPLLFGAETTSYDQGLERVGLVQIVNGKPGFLHRTFAEYFVAEFIAKILGNNEQQSSKYSLVLQLLSEEYFGEGNDTIRIFLDHFLAKPSDIHRATLKGDLEEVERILSIHPNKINSKDRLGRIPLHLSVLYDHDRITGFLLKRFNHSVLYTDLLGYGPICYAVASKSPTTTMNLLRKGTAMNSFERTLQPVMRIIQQRNLCNSNLMKELALHANPKHKAAIVQGVNFTEAFKESLQMCNNSEIPGIFLLATTNQKREMLMADNYNFIKKALVEANYSLLSAISQCLQKDNLQGELFNLHEYKICFIESARTYNFKMLDTLTKMTNPEKKFLWQQTDYKSVFNRAIECFENDIVLDLFELFPGDNLFEGVNYVGYFQKMFSERYKVLSQLSTILGCATAQQQEKIFTELNLIEKFKKAFTNNDSDEFNFLLKCSNNDQRQRLLRSINYVTAFKKAVSDCNRIQLGMLLRCDDTERVQMMKNLRHSYYLKLFREIIKNEDSELFLTLVGFISSEEHDRILDIVSPSNHRSFIHRGNEHSLILIFRTAKGIYNQKFVSDLNSIIPEQMTHPPWSVWASLLYMVLKARAILQGPKQIKMLAHKPPTS